MEQRRIERAWFFIFLATVTVAFLWLTLDFIDKELVPNYSAAGFELTERGILSATEWAELNTSWARRLQGNERRTITYLISHAKPQRST